MAEVPKIYATIHVDGKVEFDEFAKQSYKNELIRNIISRSFLFLLSGALLIFAGFASTYSFAASVITGYFGIAFLVLGIFIKHYIPIDKKNVKIITDDNGKNWLLNLIRERSKRKDFSQKQYDELCSSASLDIGHFEFYNNKVLSIISRDNHRYSVDKYSKAVVRALHSREQRVKAANELAILQAKRELYGDALAKI